MFKTVSVCRPWHTFHYSFSSLLYLLTVLSFFRRCNSMVMMWCQPFSFYQRRLAPSHLAPSHLAPSHLALSHLAPSHWKERNPLHVISPLLFYSYFYITYCFSRSCFWYPVHFFGYVDNYVW